MKFFFLCMFIIQFPADVENRKMFAHKHRKLPSTQKEDLKKNSQESK